MKRPPFPAKPSRSRPDPLVQWARKVVKLFEQWASEAEVALQRENAKHAPAEAQLARTDLPTYRALITEARTAIATKQKDL